MSVRRKHMIRCYTIVEVMVAMGIFLVMMTIMMQFFTSAQKVWNAVSKRNIMYADARIAMNVMTREIQSMLYNNDNDGTGIYPFWLEWTSVNVDSKTRYDNWIQPVPSPPKTIYEYDFRDNVSSVDYLTALNFMSTTDLKSVDEGSDVCEIRYRFVPVYFEGSTPYSINNVKGGKLERSCTAEYYDTLTLTNDVDTIMPKANPYNFLEFSYRGKIADLVAPYNTLEHQNRVATIWSNDTEDFDVAPFQTVITGVYSLRFTCYVWNTSGLITLAPMDRTAPGEDHTGSPITAPTPYDLATGTPVPVAIRIDMKLMDSKDLKKLAFNIYVAANGSSSEKAGARKQIRNLKQKMRTFSKVIYLGKREN